MGKWIDVTDNLPALGVEVWTYYHESGRGEDDEPSLEGIEIGILEDLNWNGYEVWTYAFGYLGGDEVRYWMEIIEDPSNLPKKPQYKGDTQNG